MDLRLWEKLARSLSSISSTARDRGLQKPGSRSQCGRALGLEHLRDDVSCRDAPGAGAYIVARAVGGRGVSNDRSVSDWYERTLSRARREPTGIGALGLIRSAPLRGVHHQRVVGRAVVFPPCAFGPTSAGCANSERDRLGGLSRMRRPERSK